MGFVTAAEEAGSGHVRRETVVTWARSLCTGYYLIAHELQAAEITLSNSLHLTWDAVWCSRRLCTHNGFRLCYIGEQECMWRMKGSRHKIGPSLHLECGTD